MSFLDKFYPDGADKSLINKIIMAHVLILVISNYLVTVKLDLPLLGIVKASIFTFPLVYVVADLTVRLLGRDTARASILWATVVALAFVPFVNIALGVETLLAWRIALAGSIAFGFATIMDASLFGWIREKVNLWWFAPAVASVVSITVDTYAFFAMAFHAGADPYMAVNWHLVATKHIVNKWLVSLLVVLPLYGVFLGYLAKKIGRPDIKA
jgi:queuosine precursor transporter